jgi:hypothetical protein
MKVNLEIDEQFFGYELIPDGSVPTGYRFVSMAEPDKAGIPASTFDVAMMRIIARQRKLIADMRAKIAFLEEQAR